MSYWDNEKTAILRDILEAAGFDQDRLEPTPLGDWRIPGVVPRGFVEFQRVGTGGIDVRVARRGEDGELLSKTVRGLVSGAGFLESFPEFKSAA